MSEPGQGQVSFSTPVDPEHEQHSLWIRYVDWCSAQVMRRFIHLSPDEIWSIASGYSGPSARDSVLQLARTLARQIYNELGLPEFEEWLVSYGEDPERFDRDIVGYGAPDAVRQEETPA